VGKGKRKRDAKKSNKQYSGLDQHKQSGKLLQPPFLTIGNLRPSSWIDERLPETLWCALLITHLPRDLALEVFRRVAKLTEGKFEAKKPLDVGHSGLAELAPELAVTIIELICSAPGAREVLHIRGASQNWWMPYVFVDDATLAYADAKSGLVLVDLRRDGQVLARIPLPVDAPVNHIAGAVACPPAAGSFGPSSPVITHR